jgi:hypothetical protein
VVRTSAPSAPAPATSRAPRPRAAPRENSIKMGCGSGPMALLGGTHGRDLQPKPIALLRRPIQLKSTQQASKPLVTPQWVQ